MVHSFPTERQAKRKVLLAAVEQIRGTLEAHAEESEVNATLAPASVKALHESGLLRLKLPAVLGGAEADPVTQMEVIEATTRIHPSAGWCLMIGASSVALPGAFLPDSALQQVFGAGAIPGGATSFRPSGRAIVVDGGYLLSGRWAFASGIPHAQWVNAGALVVRDGAAPEHYLLTIPTGEVQVHDNWQVLGLRGTGSCDFSVTDLFVPQEFGWTAMAARPQRGGPLYQLGIPAFVANEHVGFALGVAQQALDTILKLARDKRRGFTPSPELLAEGAEFQRFLGESDLKLQAVRTLSTAIFEEAWQTVNRGSVPGPQLQARTRGVAAWATDVAVEVVTAAFRYAGGSANFRSSALQGYLRDINAAAQHLLVNSAAYRNQGQFMLGLPGANPMA